MIIWNKETKLHVAKIASDTVPEQYNNNSYIATSDNPNIYELKIAGLLDLNEWEYIKDGTIMNWSRDEMIILRGHTELLEEGEEVIDGRVVNVHEVLLKEKEELQEWLREHDYIGTKIATGRATREEYADIIAEMNQKADRIDEINNQLYS